MAEKDYYGALGVGKTASDTEIKSAYRTMAKKYHPDKFSGSSDSEKKAAEDKFKEIQHAYDILSDPQKRAAYDQYGSEDGPMGGAGGSGFRWSTGGAGVDDIFSSIFDMFSGGGGRSTASTERDGDDIEVTLSLSFTEAAFGAEKEVTFSRIEKCSSCNGTGARGGTEYVVCPKCGGKGVINVIQQTMFGRMQTAKVCDECGGTGKKIKEACKDCGGKGYLRKQRNIKVNVPAGVDNGQSMTLRYEGNAGKNGGENGNLFINLQVKPHPIFKRDGANLRLEMPITITEATLGAKIFIPTLTKPVEETIAAGTQNGTVIRIKGKGIKNLRKDAYGDLYVTFIVDVPKNLDHKQKEALKKFEDSCDQKRYEKVDRFKSSLKDL